jgi:hypothetical protein
MMRTMNLQMPVSRIHGMSAFICVVRTVTITSTVDYRDTGVCEMVGHGYGERAGEEANKKGLAAPGMNTVHTVSSITFMLLQELLWIARAGLKEPVPEGWKPW